MLIFDRDTGEFASREPQLLCSFGIIESIVAAATAFSAAFASAGAGIAAGVGLGEATLGGISAGALIGGGLEGAVIGGLGGGALNAVEGKPILPGIGQGALVGGAIGGLGPAIGGLTGVGSTVGDVLAGAGAGALGSAVIPRTGTPLEGAIGGAGAGLVAGLSTAGGTSSAPGTSSATPSVTGGPGVSAAGIAAPPGIGDPSLNPFGGIASDAAGGAASAVGGGVSYGATSPFATGSGVGDLYGAGAGGASGATTGTSLTSFNQPTSDLYSFATKSEPAAGLVTDAASTAPASSVDWAGATAASTPSTIAQAQAGAYPLPPVPPSLDAGGSPIFDAGGAPTYPSLGDAQSAVLQRTSDLGGGVFPQQTGGARVGQALGVGPSAGTLGSDINPALGAGAGAGPEGNYTLAQGAAAGTAVPAHTNSISNFFDNPSFGNLANAASNNSGLLLGGLTIGNDLLKGNQTLPGETQIGAIANQLGDQSKQLSSYLANGTLPPGVDAALRQAGTSAQAAIRSQYAARGMSGSSAEAADLANVHNTIATQGASIATNLLNTGINEANLSASLYGQIMKNAMEQDNQLSSALATLAAASARPSISLGGTTVG